MFPAAQAKALVNACLGELDLCTSFSEARDLLDTDFDVLKEVANVILNSIMGGFGGTSFTSSQEKYTILYVLCKYVLKDKMRTKWKKPGDFKESSSFFLAE